MWVLSAVIREQWAEPKTDELKESVVSYLLKTREILLKISDLAHHTQPNSQMKQKEYYDRNSALGKPVPGQKICVLLTTFSNKLLADWKSPIAVTKPMSPMDYEIQLSRKVKTPFHIKILKEWAERTANDQLASANKIEVSNLTCQNEHEKHSLFNVMLEFEGEGKVDRMWNNDFAKEGSEKNYCTGFKHTCL